MALAREEINLEDIKCDAKLEAVLEHVISQGVEIAHLKDEQFEMRNELNGYKETISKLEDDARKDKRWNMFWRNHLYDNIDKTQIVLAIVFSINILFTYFMSR